MTPPIDIAALKALLDKATPNITTWRGQLKSLRSAVDCDAETILRYELIYSAVNALPGLLDEVERLRAANEQIHAASVEIVQSTMEAITERDALRVAMLSALSATNAKVDQADSTEFLCMGADEIRLHIKKIKAENEALRAGEIPRRFTEWSDDDGDVLWFETSLSGGEICEPPVYIGGPSSNDWCYADDDEPFLYWVPLPKIARNKPAPASTEGVPS